MIRTGRPVFHIKAKWISFDGPDGIEYYQLDSHGNLIKKDGKVNFELRKKINIDNKNLKTETKNETKNESKNNEGIFDSFPDFTSDQLDVIDDDDIFSFPSFEFNFDCFL